MSKNGKKLLNENTIRRFMKLAEIDKLSDQFVGTLSERNDDEGGEPPFDMGDAAAEEEGVEDPEADLPPEPEDVAPDAPADAEAIFTSLAQALAGVAEEHGVSMDIEGGDEPEGEELPEPEGEPEGEDLDMAAEEEPMMEEDEDLSGIELEEEVNEDEVVAEITRRVTARLMKEQRQENMADQLAERIMHRLKGSSRSRK